MITINWPRVGHYALNFVQLQAFLTLIYLPILIAWGLPLSLLSPLGNLLFSPLLTFFLLFSSIIFFCELLYIPNIWLVHVLEQISNTWLWLLNWQSKTALIGFAQPPTWALCLISLLTFIVMQIKYKNWRLHSTLLLVGLLGSTMLILKNSQPYTTHTTKIIRDAKTGSAVTCISNATATVIIDDGAIGRTISAPSWATYTLMPEIIKLTGSMTVDHFIVLRPNTMLFEALTALCCKMRIKNIYLPYWSGTLHRNTWHTFFVFQKTAKEHNVNLIRLAGTQKHKITGPIPVTILPTGKQRTYQDAKIPVMSVEHIMGS